MARYSACENQSSVKEMVLSLDIESEEPIFAGYLSFAQWVGFVATFGLRDAIALFSV